MLLYGIQNKTIRPTHFLYLSTNRIPSVFSQNDFPEKLLNKKILNQNSETLWYYLGNKVRGEKSYENRCVHDS